MNWSIAGDAASIADADITVELGEHDQKDAEPDIALVKAARASAGSLVKALGRSKDHHVEIHVHEETRGRGFRAGHVTLSVSRLDPKRSR